MVMAQKNLKHIASLLTKIRMILESCFEEESIQEIGIIVQNKK